MAGSTGDAVVDRPGDSAAPAPSCAPDDRVLRGLASPLRQHRRTPSAYREIKETLDARIEFTNDEADGRTYHRINQYVILDEIGRGSYGAVHLAKDQFGREFAMKEFSKTRLRKRAQSHLLRRGPHGTPRQAVPRGARGDGSLSPQLNSLRTGEKNDALFFIREEIAIMKKINHPNLAQLIEVLDDPEEDSLYMVLEMCRKGVVMRIGLDGDAEPYDDEACRHWFRDLILGVEYLHAQGVIHRDIKPDNLLLSEDDVLKVVDFGVSEMFEKTDSMVTARSAGSPAFTAPELCGKPREISGKAADIWSMGVSLFCLKYGKLPFVRPGIFDIYEAIKTETPAMPQGEDPNFVHLLGRILDKDPDTRITMAELREHPWVTKGATDALLSAEENCAYVVEPPNELELHRAFTPKLNNLFCVMRAIHRFKAMLAVIRTRACGPADASTAVLGDVDPKAAPTLADEAATREIEALLVRRRTLLDEAHGGCQSPVELTSDQEPLFLGIGTGTRDDFAGTRDAADVVSNSPMAVDFDVYDRAYEEAIEQQMKAGGGASKPTLYLTKFVKESERLRKLGSIMEERGLNPPALVAEMKDATRQLQQHLSWASGGKLAQLVSKVGIANPSTQGPETMSEGQAADGGGT